MNSSLASSKNKEYLTAVFKHWLQSCKKFLSEHSAENRMMYGCKIMVPYTLCCFSWTTLYVKKIYCCVWKTHCQVMDHHLPYQITQDYLPPNTTLSYDPKPSSLACGLSTFRDVWLGSLTAVPCRTCNPEVTQRHRFDSAQGHCRVTTLGKLFTDMCLCHQAV